MGVDRQQLSYVASATGYMLSYRGKPIGGAGTRAIDRDQKRHWTHAHADRKEYADTARREIDEIVAGRGQQRYMDVITRIDKEMK